jgi:hypothetical protein
LKYDIHISGHITNVQLEFSDEFCSVFHIHKWGALVHESYVMWFIVVYVFNILPFKILKGKSHQRSGVHFFTAFPLIMYSFSPCLISVMSLCFHRIRVTVDGEFLHYIFPFQFLDSPEWDSLRPTEEGIFQVRDDPTTQCPLTKQTNNMFLNK